MPIKDEDIALWKKWKKSKSPQDASELVNHLLPLVKNDIYRNSKNMPYPVVEAYGKDLILQACGKYDEKSGVSLSTFVKSYMIKLTQMNADWRSPIRIPENRSYKYNTFKTNYDELSDKLERDPTISEIADNIKWSQAEVKRFMNEIRGEFTEDRPFMNNSQPKQSYEDEMIDFIYHDLSSQEKLLFEYTTGYGGKPKLSNDQIKKRMNWNQNQLSYEKKKLVDKIDRLMKK